MGRSKETIRYQMFEEIKRNTEVAQNLLEMSLDDAEFWDIKRAGEWGKIAMRRIMDLLPDAIEKVKTAHREAARAICQMEIWDKKGWPPTERQTEEYLFFNPDIDTTGDS